jgi:hypothetical protein
MRIVVIQSWFKRPTTHERGNPSTSAQPAHRWFHKEGTSTLQQGPGVAQAAALAFRAVVALKLMTNTEEVGFSLLSSLVPSRECHRASSTRNAAQCRLSSLSPPSLRLTWPPSDEKRRTSHGTPWPLDPEICQALALCHVPSLCCVLPSRSRPEPVDALCRGGFQFRAGDEEALLHAHAHEARAALSVRLDPARRQVHGDQRAGGLVVGGTRGRRQDKPLELAYSWERGQTLRFDRLQRCDTDDSEPPP